MEKLLEQLEIAILGIASVKVALSIDMHVSESGNGIINIVQNNEDSEEEVIVAFIKSYYEYTLIHGKMGFYSILVMEGDGVKEITFTIA